MPTIAASAGSNGSISPSGNVSVASGSSQTFTITANSGYAIESLEVDYTVVADAGNKPNYTYTFSNVTSDHIISVMFKVRTSYTIAASTGSNGSISPSGNVSVWRDDDQTFNITANSGYVIEALTVDYTVVPGAANLSSYSYTFENVRANHQIDATFKAKTYTITSSAGTGGTVSPSGSVTVSHGNNRTFTASPSSGYRFHHWIVDGSSGGSSLTYTFTNVTANHTIQAVFTKTYTVQATSPEHGSVTISATGYTPQTASGGQTATLVVDTGTSVTFACTMDTGYTFSVWTEGGSVVSTNASYTATITSNKTLVANENATSYIITASASTGGTISPSGDVRVNHGANQTFTATAASGYRFDHWVVDGEIEPDQ